MNKTLSAILVCAVMFGLHSCSKSSSASSATVLTNPKKASVINMTYRGHTYHDSTATNSRMKFSLESNRIYVNDTLVNARQLNVILSVPGIYIDAHANKLNLTDNTGRFVAGYFGLTGINYTQYGYGYVYDGTPMNYEISNDTTSYINVTDCTTGSIYELKGTFRLKFALNDSVFVATGDFDIVN